MLLWPCGVRQAEPESDERRVKKVIIISVTKNKMKEKRKRTGEKEMGGAEKKMSTTSYYGGDPWIKEKENATARCCQVCNRLKSVKEDSSDAAAA